MHRRRSWLLWSFFGLAAVVLLLWIRQPFRVVGHSMEPCLTDGDWLLLGSAPPQHDDLVVFREPDSGKLAVKRVAAVPGETVQLVAGNLYLDGKRRQRPLFSIEDMVPMLDVEGAAAKAYLRLEDIGFHAVGTDRWKLEGRGIAYLEHPPTADYLLRGTSIRGEYPAPDLGLEVQYQLLAPHAALHLALRKGHSTMLAILSANGSHLLIQQQSSNLAQPITLFESALAKPQVSGRVFFTLADQVLRFSLNGVMVVQNLSYPTPEPHRLSEVPPDFSNFEHAGVGGVGPLLVGRIRLGRDILYQASGTYAASSGLQLADGQYFLLGDNSTQSRDSRQYGAVPKERILGIVASRVWPRGWSERGWSLE